MFARIKRIAVRYNLWQSLRELNAIWLVVMFGFGFLKVVWDLLGGRMQADYAALKLLLIFGLATFALADYLIILWRKQLFDVDIDVILDEEEKDDR